MTRGNLAYSAAACAALPLFRRNRNRFRVLEGGAEGRVEMPTPGIAEAPTAAESAQQRVPAPSALPAPPKKQRVPGLNRGTIKLSEDFNDPLPDEFWLGIE